MSQIHDAIERLRANAERLAADPGYQARLAEEEQQRQAEHARWCRELRTRALRAAEVPRRVTEVLGSATETDAVRAVRAFMLPGVPRSMLFLLGGTGCGKTVAACLGLSEAIRLVDGDEGGVPSARNVGRFVKAIQLVRAGTFDGEFWGALERAPVLVLDDLGSEPLDEKGWALGNIAALLDARYDARRRTIVTSNLPWARLRARYCEADGGRLLDRVREAGAVVEFDGKSMRAVAAPLLGGES